MLRRSWSAHRARNIATELFDRLEIAHVDVFPETAPFENSVRLNSHRLRARRFTDT